MRPVLYIVIPCFNEEAVLPVSNDIFVEELNVLIGKEKVSEKSRIVYVNDGSSDSTWAIISDYANHNELVTGISLSRNRGHQNAVLAGLMEAVDMCDIAISIDCDGQDDVRAMEDMVYAYTNGAEVVYGVRSDRSSDTFFKRVSAEMFYSLLNRMGVEVIVNHADYRLMSNRVLKELSGYKEVNLFLRGMIPLIGFNSTCVYYERHERLAGESHYPLTKMIKLALEGITSLSVKPIRFIAGLGLFIACISLLGIVWVVIGSAMGNTIPGWASTTSLVCFMSGVQMLSLGIIGEYIGKIYLEVKERPRYIISERTNIHNESE